MADRELFQFQGSHFNEKARWVLDLKQVPHERRSLLPGPHAFVVKRLSGDTQVPVLRDGGEVVAGSARIVEHLERSFPDPPLLPEDPQLRHRALEIQRTFDGEVGPAVRLALFFEAMDADFALGTFCRDRSAVVQALYRFSFPPIARFMKSTMAITPETAARARARTSEALDFVAEESRETGYLVGDRFSVADLAAAALLMPTVSVEEWGGPPVAQTPRAESWRRSWADHPGAEWVRATYARHRRPA